MIIVFTLAELCLRPVFLVCQCQFLDIASVATVCVVLPRGQSQSYAVQTFSTSKRDLVWLAVSAGGVRNRWEIIEPGSAGSARNDKINGGKGPTHAVLRVGPSAAEKTTTSK